MNAGTDSHGAWRRILLDVPGQSALDLMGILKSAGAPSVPSNVSSKGVALKVERLSSAEQRAANSTHIALAVGELLAGHEMPQFALSRDYDMITPDGDRLAPKKVFGRALELAGVVSNAMPGHFSAGWGQPSFELLEAAGFSIVPKSEAAAEAKRRKGKTGRSERKLTNWLTASEQTVKSELGLRATSAWLAICGSKGNAARKQRQLNAQLCDQRMTVGWRASDATQTGIRSMRTRSQKRFSTFITRFRWPKWMKVTRQLSMICCAYVQTATEPSIGRWL